MEETFVDSFSGQYSILWSAIGPKMDRERNTGQEYLRGKQKRISGYGIITMYVLDQGLSWDEVEKPFGQRFAGRNLRSLQVRW
ncbi:hypothetical protein BDV29DRAFT_183793 [Aspergillus leporis]|jgi:hypothetical protein|uniref:Uncharacterized protein n=1 Tax=Aspergillus leporis TaxID=41062 RepID=A0A5N5WP97_9EURO|nr:hypothetical protein BDV29DRAFT_183793 [Aspergillus leporis]